jgi:hypothetical protein
VLRDSPWGQLYLRHKAAQHRFYKHATFYSYAELGQLLAESGFVIENTISTLFQRPGNVEHSEAPQDGFFAAAGFTVIVAAKEPGDRIRGR